MALVVVIGICRDCMTRRGEDQACLCETVVCLQSATPDIAPTKQYAGRCVRLDLSFDPQLRREPTAVPNCKWTNSSFGSASKDRWPQMWAKTFEFCSCCQRTYALSTATSITVVLLDCFPFLFFLSTLSDCSHLLGMSIWSSNAVQTEACIRFGTIYLNSANLFPRKVRSREVYATYAVKKIGLGLRVPAVWM